MASRSSRVSVGSEWVRRRLFWTTVLVLVALGGAGLTSAVDRPHTAQYRPELGFVSDGRAAPWLAQLLANLEELEPDVVALGGAGRRVFIGASGLLIDEVEAAVDAGDVISQRLASALGPLVELRSRPPAGVETWRLGEASRDQLARIDTAIAAIGGLETVWQRMAVGAALAVELVGALERHDAAVAEALDAGREADWQRAAELIGAAGPALDEVASAGARLTPELAAPQLQELIAGHRAQDAALLALYSRLADGGQLDDPDVIELRGQVEQVRLAVPTPRETVQRVVAEAAGPWLSAQLAAIEAARGSVTGALDEGESEEELE